jgi:signal transduction histidine kinase
MAPELVAEDDGTGGSQASHEELLQEVGRHYWEDGRDGLFVLQPDGSGQFAITACNESFGRNYSGVLPRSGEGFRFVADDADPAGPSALFSPTQIEHLLAGQRVLVIHSVTSGLLARQIEIGFKPGPNGTIFGHVRELASFPTTRADVPTGAERAHLAQEAPGSGICDYDVDRSRIVFSANAAAMLGMPTDITFEDLRAAWPSVCHEDDRLLTAATLNKAIKTGGHFLADFRVHPAGDRQQTRYITMRGRVIHQAGRRRLLGIMVDVTERRLVEHQRTEALAMLRRVAQTLPGLIYVYDLDGGRLRHLNDGRDTTGMRSTDFPRAATEAALMARMHEADRASFMAHLAKCRTLADGETALLTFRLKRQDGAWRWFTSHDAVLTRGEAGRPTELLCSALDVTQRYEAIEALRHLTAVMLRTQDAERRKIARDLHDSTAQNLLGASLAIESAKGGTEPTQNLDLALSLIDTGQQEIRTLSYLLHPPLLDEVGLGAALAWYSDGFEKRTGISTRITDSRQLRRRHAPRRAASIEEETILFRVVQEALTNVYRHAQASAVQVELSSSQMADGQPAITVTVADNGRGLVAAEQHSGVGLLGMRERLRLVGGSLAVISRSGEGTTIRATCPVALSHPAVTEPKRKRPRTGEDELKGRVRMFDVGRLDDWVGMA